MARVADLANLVNERRRLLAVRREHDKLYMIGPRGRQGQKSMLGRRGKSMVMKEEERPHHRVPRGGEHALLRD